MHETSQGLQSLIILLPNHRTYNIYVGNSFCICSGQEIRYQTIPEFYTIPYNTVVNRYGFVVQKFGNGMMRSGNNVSGYKANGIIISIFQRVYVGNDDGKGKGKDMEDGRMSVDR